MQCTCAFSVCVLHLTRHGQGSRHSTGSKVLASFASDLTECRTRFSARLQKLAVNWMDGCWLVFNMRTGEHIVSNNAAVAAAFEDEKKKNVGIVKDCWVYSGLLGAGRTDVWKSILTLPRQPDTFRW